MTAPALTEAELVWRLLAEHAAQKALIDALAALGKETSDE